MADNPRPAPAPTEPRRSGSWIPLLGSAAILALMLGLIIALSVNSG